MSRWLKFILVILIGIAVGLYYAWVLNPVQVVDTTPDTLRIDFRADYVLMVAEIYQVESDPAQAARRLGSLGADPPLQIVNQAIIYAEQAGYSRADLGVLEGLRTGLQTWNPGPGGLQP
jgi:hypothetical protein